MIPAPVLAGHRLALAGTSYAGLGAASPRCRPIRRGRRPHSKPHEARVRARNTGKSTLTTRTTWPRTRRWRGLTWTPANRWTGRPGR